MNLAQASSGFFWARWSPRSRTGSQRTPHHDPLLRSVPRSARLPLVLLGTAALGGACGLVFDFTLEAVAATLFCWCSS